MQTILTDNAFNSLLDILNWYDVFESLNLWILDLIENR